VKLGRQFLQRVRLGLAGRWYPVPGAYELRAVRVPTVPARQTGLREREQRQRRGGDEFPSAQLHATASSGVPAFSSLHGRRSFASESLLQKPGAAAREGFSRTLPPSASAQACVWNIAVRAARVARGWRWHRSWPYRLCWPDGESVFAGFISLFRRFGLR